MLDVATFPPTVEASRAALLEAIGPAPGLTLIRATGNRGDELIWAGARALLDGHVYQEVGSEALTHLEGDTALITGSGAWCRPFHDQLPALLGLAERRFDRVIVLPSTFDPAEDRVRQALMDSRATVFAREAASYERIRSLCDARMAHDTAFYLDYEPYRRPGRGTLVAFRTDAERAGHGPLPDGNDDLSATAESLEAWLETIAGHEHVQSDRAHVVIAAALMGKRVDYRTSSYFKVGALVATLPAGLPVRRLDDLPPAPRREPVDAPGREGLLSAALARPSAPVTEPVCVVILSRERPDHVATAVRSALASGPGVRVLVLDANSGPATRAELRALAGEARVEVVPADTNPGCGIGRQRAVERVDEDLVLFLDDDEELMPGALGHLVADLRAHPEACATSALIADADGRTILCGGGVERGEDVIRFTHGGHGRAFDDPAVPPTGPSDWVPGGGALVRRATLLETPLDPGMRAYYEDNDWSLRVRERHPDAFRRCREALVLHHAVRPAHDTHFARRDRLTQRLAAHARFLEVHGALLHSGGEELRELLDSADPVAARLLLRLVTAYGPDWLLAEWAAGDLGELLRRAAAQRADRDGWRDRAEAAEQRRDALEAEHAWLHERNATLHRIEAGGWWRLRGRLEPLLRLAGRVRR